MALDPEEYIAIIVCATNTTIIEKGQVALVLSRKKILPSIILANLKLIMSKYVDKHDIVDVDNTCKGL